LHFVRQLDDFLIYYLFGGEQGPEAEMPPGFFLPFFPSIEDLNSLSLCKLRRFEDTPSRLVTAGLCPVRAVVAPVKVFFGLSLQRLRELKFDLWQNKESKFRAGWRGRLVV
jgi:hypothetical protein